VGENNIAYHAGISSLPGTNRSNLNGSSIGIELINTTKTPPTEAQYQSLIRLIKEIKTRHDIRYIVRHSDIAPRRKTDPWMFNWESFLKTLNEEKP
jgi:N-acetyl-anhydromuramyl-L-alanine amidase AmpD